ncbi:hypothetical protein C5E07_11310 [Pseudoclavibacter sp. RFBJ3]|uniref:hypothetical protein n=1 Tax=unclassified Pseudoclavibacter TaxID=2615177 RepID=UPI000CE7BFB9|nr:MULTISPECIES: hypothetical protein [unclassified Pseudoclavibacter]PPF83277.1 hypothetical protein C5C12_10385 [Pseudoclavibacter sp. RFBJ5]PPF91819.1 hypothetical protein C5E07_11310 [Pseudoclavibacter sp. RFBJ3]PPG01133.1 hypothetical protein C5C19_00645 [Pseudoclavibacter sp. RFBH5]PPG26236.1 hypothetical protein C5E13_00600 [Pseudoclavibacter sp. RFBI4]
MVIGSASIGSYKLEELSERLLSLASKAGRRALAGHSGEEPYDAVQTAVALGEAYEWLARSVIAAAHPVLLVGANDLKSLIALAGAAPKTLPTSGLQTVVASKLIGILKALYPKSPMLDDPVRRVLAVRNAAAHMMMTDPDDTHVALQDLTAIVAGLLEILGVSEINFWGIENRERVVDLREKRLSRLDATREAKLAAARARYEALVDGLGDAEAEGLRRFAERRFDYVYRGDDVEQQRVDCPACDSQAELVYLRKPGSDDEIEERDEYMVRPIWLVPDLLLCPVCGLALDHLDLSTLNLDYLTESDEPETVDISPNFEPDPDFVPGE